ncbi:MAG: hypothetical protein J0L72_07970 [Armatimonadetes bacterium]|nr:hypothetical protein [Armatimonadota bacterium]
MKFVLVTKEKEIILAAEKAYGTHYQLKVHDHWGPALEDASDADLMFVDLIATLTEPGKIKGYEDFAEAKMSHEKSCGTPLVVFAPPADYELDSMVGYPNFLFAMVRRPITDRFFRQASGWV